MSTYSFRVTKGIFQLSLSTTDKDMVIEQFEKWVHSAAAYTSKHKKDTNRNDAQLNAAREYTQRKIDEQLKRYPAKDVAEVPQQENYDEEPEKEDTQKDLDVFYSPNQQDMEYPRPTINTDNQEVQGVFDSILDKSMNAPQTELSFKPSPSIKKDNAFLNYISGRKVERKIDYLLMTAYYFTQYEQKPRFTLKQLNAKLMQNIAIILDHSVIQEAINREYIECLPDLTGVVGTSEYRLTAYGEKTLLEEG